ncbi:MAG: hypothetical protein ACUX7D_01015 [Candidatus Methanodesulfokora washburnensis]
MFPVITGQRGDMMRAGISRVVVEIIILVIAVALALLIFSPISGYIFGSLGRTSTVGGAANVQVLNAKINTSTTPQLTVDIKNLGPGTIKCTGTQCSTTDFQVFIDGTKASINGICNLTSGDTTCSSTTTASGSWNRDVILRLCINTLPVPDGTKQHNIVIYGPGNTQAQYLYYPPPS